MAIPVSVVTTLKGVAEVKAGLAGVSRSLKRIGDSALRAGRALTTGISLPMGIAAVASIKMAVDFEKSLSQIEGLVGVATKEVEKMRGSVLALSGETAKSPKELAKALFFVTSAGFRGAAAIDVLTQSAKAATAGLGEAVVVADAVTSAITAYGSANLNAATATGILVAAVREGKLSAESLSPVLGQILPIASTLGISFDQIAAAIAAMSRSGTKAEEAVTSLRAVMASILKPASQSRDALRGLGITFEDVRKSLREDGLLATLQKLKDVFGGNAEAMALVFPNIRALTGVLNLLGGEAENTRQIFSKLAEETGQSLNKAFDVASRQAFFKFKLVLDEVKVAAITLGTALLPAILPAVVSIGHGIKSLTQTFTELSPVAQKSILIVVAAIGTVGPLLIGIGLAAKVTAISIAGLATVAATLRTVMIALTTASLATAAAFLKVMLVPALIVTAIVALVSAGVLLIRHWDETRRVAIAVWSDIKLAVLESVLAIVNAVDGIIARKFLGLGDTLDGVKKSIQGLMDDETIAQLEAGASSAADAMEGLFTEILTDIEDMKDKATELLKAPFDLFSDAITSNVEEIKSATDDIVEDTEKKIPKLRALGGAITKITKEEREARQQLALDVLNFEIEIGNRTLEERAEILQAMLELETEGTRRQLELRKKVADVQLEIFNRDFALAQKRFNNNEMLMQQWLKGQKERFKQLEESGKLATKEIEENISRVGVSSINMAGVIQSAMQTSFSNILRGAVGFGEGLRSIFEAIANAVIAEFAKIAANEVFRILFGGADVGAGAAVGQQVLSQSGGSLFGGQTTGGLGLAGFFSPTASSIGFGVETLFGAAAGEFAGNLALSFGKFGPALVAGIPALIGSILKSVIGGTVGRIIGGLGGVVSGFLLGGPVGAVIGGLLGGFFQHGGSFITQRPQLIGVGERGAERVTIEPLGGAPARGAGGATIIFSGINVFDGIAAAEGARVIQRALRVEAGRVV